MNAVAGGRFWLPGQADAAVRGTFTAEIGNKPEARLEAPLIDDPQVRQFGGGVTFSGRAADSVTAFLPVTLHAELDTGDAMTMLNAQNYGGNGYFGYPQYRSHLTVLGAHVAGVDQDYAAVRFRLSHPYSLAHLTADRPAVVDDDGSTLSVEASDEGNWLVYSSSTPAKLRRLEIRAVSGCLVLLQLAIDPDHNLTTRETQVRLDGSETWLPLHGKGFNAPVDDLEHDPLIPRDALTVDQFAKWIALNDRFDGLAWAVARPQKGVLQTQVQIVSSLVEGLHRRLPYQQTKFPGVLKTARAAIVEAARNAAGAAADTEGVDRQAAMDSVAFLTDVSFRTRATEIVTEVCGAVPEIAESITDLPGRITKARNDFAHHLPQDEGKEPLEVRYLRWLVVANVTPWLLRGLLLLRAGVDAKTLRDGYLASNRFEHFRANTAQHVKELGWELPQKD